LDAQAAASRTRRRVARIALCAAVAGGWWWESGGQDRFVPRRFVEVVPGRLYRSGQIDRRLIREVLERNGIGLVVALRDDDPGRADHREEQLAARTLGIERVVLNLRGDGTGDPQRYVIALAAMARAQRAGEAVLVHCAAGARRSAAAVALYQLLVEGASPEVAYRELRRFGRPVEESPLLPYLNANLRGIAEQLVAIGVIASVPEPLPVLAPPSRRSAGQGSATMLASLPRGVRARP
jgi:protein tyrosine phosphatase (PTP) superfamily phosphohydrolase (DUF442 family)